MNDSLFSSVLSGKISTTPPIWLMRQAGRYQKSYQKVRKKHSFWEICQTPEIACQVTCAPILEFDFDAAIIFSDILVIPDALGQQVSFTEFGPQMAFSIQQEKDLQRLTSDSCTSSLQYVYQAIQHTRQHLHPSKPLIGFAGAPFTIALYMIEGLGTKNFNKAQNLMNTNPQLFQSLIKRLCLEIANHLICQAKSGVQALQIFDSWAASLDNYSIDLYSINPLKEIIKIVKKKTQTPIIVYSSASSIFPEKYNELDCQALSFPANITLNKIQKNINNKKVIQGNFSQHILSQEHHSFKKKLRQYLEQEVQHFNSHPFIFNLGHGVLPYTPESNIKYLVEQVKGITLS